MTTEGGDLSHRRALALAILLGLLLAVWAPAAAADPMLTVLPTDDIPLGSEAMLTIRVDPADTPLSSFVLNFSASPSGIGLLDLTTTFSPTFDAANGLAGVAGTFGTDQTEPFDAGTIRLRGLAAGTPLILSEGSVYVDANFNDIPAGGPRSVATVVPEPSTALLCGLGLIGLGWLGRGHLAA